MYHILGPMIDIRPSYLQNPIYERVVVDGKYTDIIHIL